MAYPHLRFIRHTKLYHRSRITLQLKSILVVYYEIQPTRLEIQKPNAYGRPGRSPKLLHYLRWKVINRNQHLTITLGKQYIAYIEKMGTGSKLTPSEREQLPLRSEPLVPWRNTGHVTGSSGISRKARIPFFFFNVKSSWFPILTTDLNIKHNIDQQCVI